MQIKKKNGVIEHWDGGKIRTAVTKASERVGIKLTDYQLSKIEELAYNEANERSDFGAECLSVVDLHNIVRESIEKIKPEVAKSYQEFRDYKNTYAKEFDRIKSLADDVLLLGDKENANFDSSLISTKGSLIKGYLTKSLYEQFYLSKKEKEYIKRGDIYIHDLRDMILGCFNCCLFDIGNVLEGGFEMSNVKYTEPTSVLSALQVIGDITLVATAQQFGGFTLPELDKVLIPYCHKTYDSAIVSASLLTDDEEDAEYFAWSTLKRELEQGFQSLELKLNTVPCSRGDFAFTTITFGHIPDGLDSITARMYYLIGSTILKTRQQGHGGKPVVFPKLVFLYEKNKIQSDYYADKLFQEALECSSKCMYPDYLSIDDCEEYNVVAKLYLEEGVITSPMGCRAYLTPWNDPETGEFITTGRCNIGAVSLNLPVIMEVCKQKHGAEWRTHLKEELDDRLETIREFLKKRYDIIRHSKASSNPMAFTQGGLYKGELNPDDEVGDLVQYMTASFGITALNEATVLWTDGKETICSDNTFAKIIVDHINKRIEEFKEQDGYLYALYGTPAESLCSTQAKQYARLSGDHQFGEYFSNSFHCHVSEHINPIEKQVKEFELFHKCNGGHIQYVRLENPENIEALRAIVERGMALGFYQGVNFDSAYCNDCGRHSSNVMFKCPHCGSSNLTVISRVCGYLGYSNVNGSSRMNDGKMAEIRDRVSM